MSVIYKRQVSEEEKKYYDDRIKEGVRKVKDDMRFGSPNMIPERYRSSVSSHNNLATRQREGFK